MTNTQRAALGVVSVTLVALGLFLIVGNERETAASPSHAMEVGPAPMAPTTTAPVPSEPPTGASIAASPQAMRDAGAAPVETSGPTVELAPSPFENSDSPELQYAVKLVLSESTGPREWHKAAEVFLRCVDQNPTNHLCRRGLYAAWERIDSDGGRPTALSTTGPLGIEPNPTMKPLKMKATAE